MDSVTWPCTENSGFHSGPCRIILNALEVFRHTSWPYGLIKSKCFVLEESFRQGTNFLRVDIIDLARFDRSANWCRVTFVCFIRCSDNSGKWQQRENAASVWWQLLRYKWLKQSDFRERYCMCWYLWLYVLDGRETNAHELEQKVIRARHSLRPRMASL